MSLKNHNYRQILKILTKYYNFTIERQIGSHIQLKHSDGRRLTIPRHDPIKIDVLKAIIEQAETTQEEFLNYMGSFFHVFALLDKYDFREF